MHRNSTSLAVMMAYVVVLIASRVWAATDFDTQQLRTDAASRAGRGPSHGQSAFGIVPAGQEGNPNFTLIALLPAFYNSNADASEVDGTYSGEYNPDVRLTWKQAFRHELTVSALVDVNSDRYPSAHESDSDTAFGRFRVQHISGSDDQELQPFIQYSPSLGLAPFFSGPTSASHDFRLGIDQSINFQDAFHTRAIRKADSSDEALWAITYTVDLWRRHTNHGTDSTRLEVDPALSWFPLGQPWNMSLEVDLVPIWYDHVGGSHRHDFATTALMTFEYQPTWLPLHTKLDFQIEFARVDSSQAQSSFQQWVVGPTLRASIPL
jgi:hypothetical protein